MTYGLWPPTRTSTYLEAGKVGDGMDAHRRCWSQILLLAFCNIIPKFLFFFSLFFFLKKKKKELHLRVLNFYNFLNKISEFQNASI
jgi:hypothetical protein